MTPAEMVREFHEAFGLPVRDVLEIGGEDELDLRWELQREETDELGEAFADSDPIEIADALADIVYVAYGTAVQFGIDLDAVIAEVHRSNMSKLGEDGKPVYRDDGKVLKGPGYFKPDIAGVIGS